jgi:hypothetical protein
MALYRLPSTLKIRQVPPTQQYNPEDKSFSFDFTYFYRNFYSEDRDKFLLYNTITWKTSLNFHCHKNQKTHIEISELQL